MDNTTSLLKSRIDQKIDFNKRILIVEDDDVSFMLLDEILATRSINPSRAIDGSEAINLFRKNKYAFDLVLMDIRMPKINGYEATREIKEINPSVPIVAVTAFAHSQGVIDCYNSGCDAYIAKPFDINKFFRTIEDYLVLKN